MLDWVLSLFIKRNLQEQLESGSNDITSKRKKAVFNRPHHKSRKAI